MIWVLCLLCAGGFQAAHAGLLRTTSKTEDKAAPQEEVNVLMFGVIQFSESLDYIYKSTEAKIEKINQTLKSQEDALQQLEEQTGQAAEVEKQIKDALQLLKDQMAKQQTQTTMTKDRLAHMEQEEMKLESKVKKLEMYLNNPSPTSIKELQESAAEHSSILKSLEHFNEYQKQNIENHKKKLSKLQKMVSWGTHR